MINIRVLPADKTETEKKIDSRQNKTDSIPVLQVSCLLFMAALRSKYFRPVLLLLLLLLLLLFSSPNLSRFRLDVYHTSTHDVALVRIYIGCRSETCCTRLAENTGRKKSPKKSRSTHHRTNLSGYTFANKALIDNRKNLVKQPYLLHTSSQRGELRPTSG